MASSADRKPGANRPRRRKPAAPKPDVSTPHPAPEAAPPLNAAEAIGDPLFMRYADPGRRAELFRSLQSTYGNAAVERLARSLQPPRRPNPAPPTPIDRAESAEVPSAGAHRKAPAARVSQATRPPVTSTPIGTSAGLQREDKPPPATLEEAIRAGDSSEFKRFRPFPPLNAAMLSGICSVILGKIYVTSDDEKSLEYAWIAYGAQNAKLAVDFELWKRCAARGADIENVLWLKQMHMAFKEDVTNLTTKYLEDNLKLVEGEMEAAGIPLKEGEAIPAPTADQEADLQDMQAAAESVRRVQEEQERSRETYVGYSVQNPLMESKQMWLPVKFDPFHKPEKPSPPEYDPKDPSPMKQPIPVGPIVKTQDYDALYAAYTKGTKAIEDLVMVYPMLYAISRQGNSADTKQFANTKDPKAAREQLAGSLKDLRKDINRAKEMLGKELNPLDLLPVHENLFAGDKTRDIKVNWTTDFARALANEQVEGHATEKALKALGYEVLSQMAFMLGGSLPGAGGVAVMLVGLWASKQKTNMSGEEYRAMLTASKTAVTPGTEIVDAAQVDTAKAQADADAAAFGMAMLNTASHIASMGASWAQETFKSELKLMWKTRIPKVSEEVEVTSYPKTRNDEFETDMNGAKKASDDKTGPEFHGEVEAGENRRAYATGSRRSADPDEAPDSVVTGPPPGAAITRGEDGFPLSEHTARAEYRKQMRLNPGREVALVQNRKTKSWAVSIGEEAEVSTPERGLYGEKSLKPNEHWSFHDHYHPNFSPKNGNFETHTSHMSARVPSGKDMEGALTESGAELSPQGKVTKPGRPVTERLSWLDYDRRGPNGQPQVRTSTYGVIPGQAKPYWVRFFNAAGRLELARFNNVAAYEAWRGANFYGH